MKECPIDLIEAAASDRLPDDKTESLQSHLNECETCRKRLDDAAAPRRWWQDASRLLDLSALDDPSSDVADSSAAEAMLFEGDDPVSELKAAGVLENAAHPEMLGQLGRYAIEREIGTGGMGVVLKGHDGELNRTVAIKVLAPHLARSGAARQRFVREGRAAAAVVHENVVAIHEVDTSGRLPTLVMRYVDGVSLQRHVDTVGPLPVCDALRIAAQTAAGLEAAHRQGIVHRDVKPGNILVGGGGARVWITDFGLARAVDDASLTRTGFIAGTPHYMSPEQARGGAIGPASDLFSLGAVIYFMFAARPPWRAERSLAVLHRIVQQPHRPIWQLNPDVPREVSSLVDRLLSKTPSVRGQSAGHVKKELETMLSKLQNPEAPHSLVGGPVNAPKAKTPLLARPLLLVPLTAALTVAAMKLPQWWSAGTTHDRPTDLALPIANTPAIAATDLAHDEYEIAPIPRVALNAPIPPSNSFELPQVDRQPAGEPSLRSSRDWTGRASTTQSFGTAIAGNAIAVPVDTQRPQQTTVSPRAAAADGGRATSGASTLQPATGLSPVPTSGEPSSTISEQTWTELSELEFMVEQAEAVVIPSSRQNVQVN